ncbi:hypothetical protein PIB30_089983, partial [Stylosanthes scabra]|nr:hypothetical protein [Stylosanthes scabra]
MGWGFSFRIFQAFQVQVRAWKVGEAFFRRVWFSFSTDESSVVFCRRISEVCPEYVVGFRALCNGLGLRRFQSVNKVEPLGYMKNEEMKLEEQKGRKLEHSARAPMPRHGVQSSNPGVAHPRLGVAQQASSTPK